MTDLPEPLSTETARLLSLSATATITAQLAKRGIRNSFLSGLAPIRPGQRMVGVARTLRYVPMREDMIDVLQKGQNAQRRVVETARPGDVIVMEARNEPGAGTIGDVLAMRAEVLGATGIVTDGGVRDAGAVAKLDVPVYLRASHGATFSREHLPLDHDVPIACAGVLVFPGDAIVGDEDGVVVIPRALVDDIAMESAEQELMDMWAFERVKAGESTVGVFPLSDARRADFEAWRARLS
jgi:5-oxopent-3-ene-1,2,5-tricarboxylate decarboxylase / 2-hydroxyhepta-2,4-diene-1,7-dioate isomerase